jgi:methionine biosynthesis protein MetW
MSVDRVLNDVLRVGRWGIVSFPNFAYHKLRQQLYEEGRAPRAGAWLGHNWYDTPNVRFLSIADFEDYCRQKGIRIHRQIALDTALDREVYDDPNLNADVAIVVVSR